MLPVTDSYLVLRKFYHGYLFYRIFLKFYQVLRKYYLSFLPLWSFWVEIVECNITAACLYTLDVWVNLYTNIIIKISIIEEFTYFKI